MLVLSWLVEFSKSYQSKTYGCDFSAAIVSRPWPILGHWSNFPYLRCCSSSISWCLRSDNAPCTKLAGPCGKGQCEAGHCCFSQLTSTGCRCSVGHSVRRLNSMAYRQGPKESLVLRLPNKEPCIVLGKKDMVSFFTVLCSCQKHIDERYY